MAAFGWVGQELRAHWANGTARMARNKRKGLGEANEGRPAGSVVAFPGPSSSAVGVGPTSQSLSAREASIPLDEF